MKTYKEYVDSFLATPMSENDSHWKLSQEAYNFVERTFSNGVQITVGDLHRMDPRAALIVLLRALQSPTESKKIEGIRHELDAAFADCIDFQEGGLTAVGHERFAHNSGWVASCSAEHRHWTQFQKIKHDPIAVAAWQPKGQIADLGGRRDIKILPVG